MLLEAFFNPKSVAVIGASRTPGKIGYAILESLKTGYKGKIFPINPEATEILGLIAFPSVLSIPEQIDLAVIAIPAEKVEEAIIQVKKKKIKAAIVISSGFSEIGEKERELRLLKAKGKTRLLGPNCIGVVDAYSGIDTLFMPKERLKRPKEGGIGFITQSGAFGSALLDLAAQEGIGISKFISIGNRIDVNEIELLEYLGKDPHTRAIALYLESVSDGKKFLDISKKTVQKKPIVCLKAGKTQHAEKAVLSHTGSLAGSYQVYRTAFKQAGVIEAKSTEELFDFAKALASQPHLKDSSIAIVTDGGGFGIVAADAADEAGLELAQLDNTSVAALKQFLPPYASFHNPIDLTGDSNAERYKKTLDIVFKDKNVSGVCIIALLQIATLEETITDVLRDCKMHGKPFVVCATGGEYTQQQARKLEAFGIPVYSTPERAVKALAALADYGQVLKAVPTKPAEKKEKKRKEKIKKHKPKSQKKKKPKRR